jgi:peroxin-2
MQDDVIDRFQPEIDALLQVLVYRISIWSQERTYGQQLQNLKFKPLSIRQKLLYLLLSIGIPYLLKRFQVLYQLVTGSEDPPPNEVVRRIGRIERIYQFLSTLNFLLLLWRADYVSPIHRLLGMQQTYLRPQMARRVSFEYMNRQVRSSQVIIYAGADFCCS